MRTGASKGYNQMQVLPASPLNEHQCSLTWLVTAYRALLRDALRIKKLMTLFLGDLVNFSAII